MSIIKSILHKYNATSKAYDTLHPETESAQVTDWNQGIVNTLASTALGGLVNTLTSDSLLAKMIQKVLTATGVKYNIDQNGYICFGSLFGGLIIQWGTAKESTGQYDYRYFNIQTSEILAMVACCNGKGNYVSWVICSDADKFVCGIGDDYISADYVKWIAICK